MTASSERKLSREQLQEVLWTIVAQRMDKDPSQIRPDDQLVRDLGADSLGVMEVSMELEEELGITLPDELLDNTSLTMRLIEDALWDLYQKRG